MNKKHSFYNFIKHKSGATAIEYGLIVALIAVGIIASAETFSKNANTTFKTVVGKMESAD